MASQDRSNAGGWFSGAGGWIHHNFLWLLVATYVLAALFPRPAQAIRGLSFGQSAGSDVTTPMLLLALLLFCAASVVEWSQLRDLLQKPGILLLGLLAVWIMPSLYVSLLSWVLPALVGDFLSAGMMVGLALVAAMPVANSSVAWTQNARGNVALGLGLIVITIVLSPVATPQILKFMGLMLSEQETRHCEALVTRFSGMFFIIWVIGPSAAGLVCNRLAGPQRIEQARSWIRLISALALLTLNYSNASLAVAGEPGIFGREGLQAILFAAVLAASISVLGMACAWVISRWLTLEKVSWISLIFGFSMKHTGLALVLAGEVLQEEPRAILMIIMATLLQHIVAGIADRWLQHHGHRGEIDAADHREPENQ